MMCRKQFVLDFAEYYNGSQAPVEEVFDTFLAEQESKPEPELGICLLVLESAAEMCNVSMIEIESGLKYGELPTV